MQILLFVINSSIFSTFSFFPWCCVFFLHVSTFLCAGWLNAFFWMSSVNSLATRYLHPHHFQWIRLQLRHQIQCWLFCFLCVCARVILRSHSISIELKQTIENESNNSSSHTNAQTQTDFKKRARKIVRFRCKITKAKMGEHIYIYTFWYVLHWNNLLYWHFCETSLWIMYDFVFSGALVNSFVFRLAEEKYTDRRKRKKQNEAQKWLLMLEISRMYVVALKRKLVFEVLCVCFFFIRAILAAFASHFFAHWDGNGTWNCAKAPFAHDNSYTYNTKSWTINSLSNMLIIFVGCPFFSTSVRWRISFLCIIHGLDFRVFILSFEHWFFKTVSAVFFFSCSINHCAFMHVPLFRTCNPLHKHTELSSQNVVSATFFHRINDIA